MNSQKKFNKVEQKSCTSDEETMDYSQKIKSDVIPSIIRGQLMKKIQEQQFQEEQQQLAQQQQQILSDTQLEEEDNNNNIESQVHDQQQFQMEEPTLQMQQSQQQVKKRKGSEKKVWLDSYKLIGVQYPIELDLSVWNNKRNQQQEEDQGQQQQKKRNTRNKKRFKIKIHYLDDKKKIREYTVWFGRQNRFGYVIDGISDRQAQLINDRMVGQLDPFQQNFWNLYMLNKGRDLKKNYQQFMTDLIEEKILF